jgi:hypothetical protein
VLKGQGNSMTLVTGQWLLQDTYPKPTPSLAINNTYKILCSLVIILIIIHEVEASLTDIIREMASVEEE